MTKTVVQRDKFKADKSAVIVTKGIHVVLALLTLASIGCGANNSSPGAAPASPAAPKAESQPPDLTLPTLSGARERDQPALPWPSDEIMATIESAAAQVVVANQRDQRIVDGVAVKEEELPWQVSLFVANYPPLDGHFCGGVLIQPTWVVTAAHCVKNRTTPGMFKVLARTVKLSSSQAETANVQRIILHDAYSAATDDNDIALIQLASPISATPIRILAQAEDSRTDPPNSGTVSGWGKTREKGGDFPDSLLKAIVPFVSASRCKAAYEKIAHPITKQMLCAGETEKDACQGDSGGPLQVPDGKGGFALAGIVSFGRGCGRGEFPGVYTRVSKFESWIRSNIQPNRTN